MKTPAFAKHFFRGFTIGFPYLVLIYSRLCPLACRLVLPLCHQFFGPQKNMWFSFNTLDGYLQIISNNDIDLLFLRCFEKDMYGMWKYTNPDTHLCVFFSNAGSDLDEDSQRDSLSLSTRCFYDLSHPSKRGSWVCTADFSQQLPIWQNKAEILKIHVHSTGNCFVALPGRIIALGDQMAAFFSACSRAYQRDSVFFAKKL